MVRQCIIFNKSFSALLGKADTLAYFVKMINSLYKYFKKRNKTWPVWKIFLRKTANFLCYVNITERKDFCWKWSNSNDFGEITFEKVTVKLTMGNLTVIWDVSIQMVWRNCKVEGNYGESSNSVRRRRKKWSIEGGIANISKEEYFLPSLVAKANLAPHIPQACDPCGLWNTHSTYTFTGWLNKFQGYVRSGQSADV